MEKLENLVFKTFIFLLVCFIILPLNSLELSHYQVQSGYIGLSIFLGFFLPYLAFKGNYLRSTETRLVWGLRLLAILIFSIQSFSHGISKTDIFSLCGYMLITFFYEFGWLIIHTGNFRFFIKSWAWISGIFCIYALIRIIPIVIDVKVPVAYSPYVQENIHYTWPNEFSFFVIISWFMAMYLSRDSKYYRFFYLIFVPILLLTFCRTSFLLLGCFWIIYSLFWTKKKRTKLIKSLIIICISISIFLVLNARKEVSYEDTRGARFEHSVKMRWSRWDFLLRTYFESPLIGNGFRSIGKTIPEFITYQGHVAKLYSSHNDFFDILLKGGIIYFGAFIFFLYRSLWNNFLHASHNKQKRLYILLLFSLLTILCAGLTHNPLKDELNGAIFWIFIAAVGHYSKLDFNEIRCITVSRWRGRLNLYSYNSTSNAYKNSTGKGNVN